MRYRVEIPPAVEKEITGLPGKVQERVHYRILKLAASPSSPGAKRLLGMPFWRVRVGDYRIIYELDVARRRIILTRVRHRKDVYRGM